MNAFDFTNLSDIAETNPELAKKVANAAQDNINAVVDIFKAGAAAGHPVLTLAQVQVAALRLEVDLPADATVRKYVNTAIEQGLIVKVTRQSYAAADADLAAVEVDEDEATEEAGAADTTDDALAGIE